FEFTGAFKSGAKATALQTLREVLRFSSCAKRLECGRFSAAFVRSSKFEVHCSAFPFSNRGSILVGLLWCLALLSIVVIGVLHTARMDLKVGKNYGDRIQAHYLALAGIEKAKALLYRDAKERSRSRQNHGAGLYDSPADFENVALGRGRFQVFRRGRDDEGGGILYGVSDEESRINLNIVSSNSLSKLEDLTPDIIAAIADWRDPDNAVSPGGAESEYYLTLQPPYQTRNGPFQTVRELLMIRGMSPELLLGNDRHQNGLLDSEDDEDGKEQFANAQVSDSDLGWARLFTVNSGVNNVNAAGEDRVNVQTAGETELTKISGISPEIARAIVSYRGRTQLRSIADLLDVTAGNAQTNSGSGNSQATQNNSAGSGRKVIDEDLLLDIADDVTVDSNNSQPGAININTASLDVLATLPGVERELAQSIISYRQSSGFFPNIAWLLKVPGFDQNLLKQVAPLVTARSETFRILSEGRVNSSGVRQRIQMTVHVGLDDISTLSYREDDL
ncbi:MAG TPA: helix-hairpin-helix domain-containing protein, partial [Verrucomicrobiae bacterium]|nr:helix-hairpin-helix domain-containing protein [Verrucomicrobiae bacterium]